LGIAPRIALLSWIVAMTTLLIFVFVTVPQQKRVFLRNLESKANGVAVSLREAAAGAAVNEDFASVVTAGTTLVNGDPSLDFLVISKNDGFSLIIETDRWRSEPRIDPFWLPPRREPTGRIAAVPLGGRPVYHYAQPFDYSGIEWGWIHVGLSLKGYNHSVRLLHRNTLLLGLACALFSLSASLLYAKRLVRPILRLQQVVRTLAEGNLTVRAEAQRNDEMGALAQSVNSMADSLLRRDRILESVRFAAQRFLQTERWEDAASPVLRKIGDAAGVSRAYLFENFRDAEGHLCCALRHEWAARGIAPQISNPALRRFRYIEGGFGRCCALLGRNQIYSGIVSQMGERERAILEPQDIRSLVLIPVFVEGAWWGAMGLDDCVRERGWTQAEEGSLRAAADILGATIARQRVQDALMDAKATLEERVEDRTRELKEQIAAKEQALTALAEAQSSLLEVSRAAGMAEVATGVLHNVGNVLNSVNVSCTLLMDQLRHSRIDNLFRVVGMMDASQDDLAHFFAEDPRGRRIPAYLSSLAAALNEERRLMLKEGEALHGRVDHIKEIVSMQQNYGRVSGVLESLEPEQLMEDALKLNAAALDRHGIKVHRDYQPTPPLSVDKHNVLQILLNLIANAKFACARADIPEKEIAVRISLLESKRLQMVVSDNGIGIPAENLTRIFQHGFTTRKTGHGFGLHSGALAARAMGGKLSVHSDGPGRGAAFTLELPFFPRNPS
jgi:signal transduction histidine kinase